MLPETDKPHFRQQAITLEKRLPKTDEGENTANAHINWLKHGRFKVGGPRIDETSISELDVIYVICAGYGNSRRYTA